MVTTYEKFPLCFLLCVIFPFVFCSTWLERCASTFVLLNSIFLVSSQEWLLSSLYSGMKNMLLACFTSFSRWFEYLASRVPKIRYELKYFAYTFIRWYILLCIYLFFVLGSAFIFICYFLCLVCVILIIIPWHLGLYFFCFAILIIIFLPFPIGAFFLCLCWFLFMYLPFYIVELILDLMSRYIRSFNSFYYKLESYEFPSPLDFKNIKGQRDAKMRHKVNKKKNFNREQTNLRINKSSSRQPRQFCELPNGAFYKCDHSKIHNKKFRTESLSNYYCYFLDLFKNNIHLFKFNFFGHFWSYLARFFRVIEDFFPNFSRNYNYICILIQVAQVLSSNERTIPEIIHLLKDHAYKSKSCPPDLKGFLSIVEKAARIYFMFRSESDNDELDDFINSVRPKLRYYLNKFTEYLRHTSELRTLDLFSSFILSVVDPRSSRQGVIDSLSSLISGLIDDDTTYEIYIYFLCSVFVPVLYTPSKRKPPRFYTESMKVSDMITNFELFGSTDFFQDVSKILKFFCFMSDEKSFFYRIMNQSTSIKDFLTSSIGIGTALYGVWTGSVHFDELFFGPSDIQGLIVESNELLNESTYEGQFVEGRRDLLPYVTELGALLKKIKSKITILPKRHEFRSKLSDLKSRVHERWELCHLKVLKSRRSPPAVVLLTGPPGQGKSIVRNHIFNIWSCYDGLGEFKEQYVYPRTQGEKFWDGLDCLTNPYCYFAEVADATTSILSNTGDERLDEILSCADSAPKSLAMAFEKGSQYCLFKGIIMDSNNPTMGVEKYKNCPGAYLRRLIRVYVSLKPEFCIPGTSILDKSKLSGSLNMGIYKYKVEKYHYNDRLAYEYRDDGWKFILPDFGDNRFCFGTHWNSNGEIIDPVAFEALMLNLYSKHHVYENLLKDQVHKFNMSMPSRYDRISHYAHASTPNVNSSSFGSSDYLDREDDYDELHVDNFSQFEVESQSSIFKFKTYFILTTIFYFSCCYSLFATVFPFNDWLVFLIFFIVLSEICKQFGRGYLHIILYVIFTSWLCFYFLSINVLISLMFVLVIQFWNGFTMDHMFMIATEVSDYFMHGDPEVSAGMQHFFTIVKSIFQNIRVYAPLVYKIFLTLQGDKNPIVIGALLFICNYSIFKRSYHSEGKFDSLSDAEKHYNCGQSFTRIAAKRNDLWNVIDNKFSPVHKHHIRALHDVSHRNVRYIGVVWPNGKLVKQHCLGIKGNLAICNRHSFPDKFNTISIHIYDNGDRVKHSVKVTYDEMVIVAEDVIMVPIRGSLFRNIVKHFPSKSYAPHDTSGLIDGVDVRITPSTPITIENPNGPSVNLTTPLIYEWDSHKSGTCGLPLLGLVGNGSSILGIHSFGSPSDNYCGASLIFESQLLDAISSFETYDLVPHSVGDMPENVQVIPNVGPKSAFRFEGYDNIECYGRLPGKVMAHSKSRLVRAFDPKKLKSLFKKHFDFEPTQRFGRPMMQAQVINGVYYNPYNVGLRKMDKPLIFMPKDMKIHAAFKFTERMKKSKSLLPKGEILRPLTVYQAINGVKDDYALNRLNRSTSAGFGFHGTKDSNLIREDDGINSIPTEELAQKVLRIINCYAEGDTCSPIYTAALKDEPRPLEKCVTGKTRLFYVGPLDHLLVQKMFLSPFYALMRVDGDLFGTSIGINAHTDFDVLYRKFRDFSPYIMEGDYSGFDVSASYDVRSLASKCMCDVLSHLGYTEEHITVVKGILTDNIHLNFSVLQDVVCRPGAQGSGKDATAEDNSWFHLLMFYIFYYNTVDYHKHGDFEDNVLVTTYGDDCLLSVKPCIKDVFNNVTYQSFCKDYFGMTFTTASKDLNMQEFVKLEESQFLKRTFHYNEKFDHYFALLDLNSLFKSLEWRIPSPYVTEEQQMESTLNSFLTESFFYLPDHRYNVLRDELSLWFVSHFGWKPKLRAFEDIAERFKRAAVSSQH